LEIQRSILQCIRNDLGIADELVIGHVGRFTYVKNHQFLIQIAEVLYNKGIKFKMLLLGIGEKETEIREMINEKGLSENVYMLGSRENTYEYYQ
jgi:glycosyltransferase involved in cell wall biosynthesis